MQVSKTFAFIVQDEIDSRYKEEHCFFGKEKSTQCLVRILPSSSFYSSFPSLRNISIVILFCQVYFVFELCTIKEQLSLFYCGNCFN